MSEAEDRGLARRIAARANIRDVRLLKSSFELEEIPTDGRQFNYALDITERSVDWEPSQPLFTVRCSYAVSLAQLAFIDEGDDPGPSEEQRPIAMIEFTMAALFELAMRTGDEPPTEEELSAYASTTGAFALYPFVREYVYDVTGRLRVPALTLPVQIIEVTEDEAIE